MALFDPGETVGGFGSADRAGAPSGLSRVAPSQAEPLITSPDFTVADVLAWARTKPADEEYDYVSNENCAIAQFLKATGRAVEPAVAHDWYDWALPAGHRVTHEMAECLDFAAEARPCTFAAFAKRLEALV